MILFSFYVPDSHLEEVKNALFQAGAGKIGNYDQCCWQTKGRGQFRPLPGSDPSIGAQGTLEFVDEWKVELVIEDSALPQIKQALLDSHPYETPAYHALAVVK